MEKPNYYAIINASVRYDKSISANEKLLYAEITAMLNINAQCFASNNYFSNLYGVDASTIQRWLRSLENNGYIKRVVVYKEGTKQVEKRYIQLCGDPSPQKCGDPHLKNAQDNNNLTDSNNKNNKKSVFSKNDLTPRTEDTVPIQYFGKSFTIFKDTLPEDFRKVMRAIWQDNFSGGVIELENFYNLHAMKGTRHTAWYWKKVFKSYMIDAK